jgi:hypothetical protein
LNELEKAKAQYEAIEIPEELKIRVEKTIEEHQKETTPSIVEVPKGSTLRQAQAISGGKRDFTGFKKFTLGFITAAVLCIGIFGLSVHYGVWQLNTPVEGEKVVLPVKLSDGDSEEAQTLSMPVESESDSEETSKKVEETIK